MVEFLTSECNDDYSLGKYGSSTQQDFINHKQSINTLDPESNFPIEEESTYYDNQEE